jgi:two-component system sensor histidine kinase UhpB
MRKRLRTAASLSTGEERFRRYFELGLVGMGITSPTKGYLDVNDEMCKILGYERSELLQKPWTELTYPEDLPADLELFDRVLNGRLDQYSIDKRFVRKNGQVIDTTISVKGVRLRDGTVDHFIVLLQDISDRKRAETQLRATGERLRALAARFNSSREDEGRRIARELHDELGSMLTAVRWDVQHLEANWVPTFTQSGAVSVREDIAAILASLDAVSRTVRRISCDLRPRILDELGLVAAIEWQAEHLHARTGMTCTVGLPLKHVDLTGTQATALFRICQEAVTNIIRHANATRAHFRMAVESGTFVLQISDNGRGIRAPELAAGSSLGLLGMVERVSLVSGNIDFANAPDGGMVVTVRLPIHGCG